MKIAISGAGVAGPSLAHWLHRTGHQPTLIERAPQFRTCGYVIDFWGVGYRVAQLMGIEAAVCVSLLAGEGTGLAMTGAYVLAGELACARGDYRRAFDAYEARLRRFVEGKQTAAQKFVPAFAPQTRLGIWCRDLAMRTMNFRPLADLVLTRSVRDDFELPNYPTASA